MKVAIVDNSPKIKDAVERQVAEALEAIGLAAEANAKIEVTRAVYDTTNTWYKRTGALRNSITHASDGESAYVGSNLEYAPYVEMGTGKYVSGGRKEPWFYQDGKGKWHVTSGMPPRPFIKPAVENYMDEYKKLLERYLVD